MHNEFAKCEIKTSVFSGRKPPAGNYCSIPYFRSFCRGAARWMPICKAAQGHRHAGVSPRILATFQMKLNARPGARQRVRELMSHPLFVPGWIRRRI